MVKEAVRFYHDHSFKDSSASEAEVKAAGEKEDCALYRGISTAGSDRTVQAETSDGQSKSVRGASYGGGAAL